MEKETAPSSTIHPRVTKSGTLGKPGAASVPITSQSAETSHAEQLKPNQQSTPRNSFTELMSIKRIGFGIALLAAAIAAGLGALHALEPGHGKTIVAAYLVGSKGTARHALLLGMIVTISHTAGVYLLGAVTLYAQKYILPDRIYPFLGVLSGILIAGMGCYLFLQRYVGGEFAHTHSHNLSLPAGAAKEGTRSQSGKVSARQVLVLGITGGIVPCPAALVVLLSAVALHRTGFGLFLIVAFSIGLAAVLIAMGLVAVYAGRMMSRLPIDSPLVQRWLPMGSAAMIIALGCIIVVRGLMAAGIVQIRMWS
jgi:ABC-type nickel/cobalt efflux system permease component RcnA